MAPNGKVLSGLRWFLNFMVAQGYPAETVEEVRNSFLLHTFSLFLKLIISPLSGAIKDASAWLAEGRPPPLQLVLQEDRVEGWNRIKDLIEFNNI